MSKIVSVKSFACLVAFAMGIDQSGLAQSNGESRAVITNCGATVNSPFSDFAPVISADGSVLIFTSRRPVTAKELKKNKESAENVYTSALDEATGEWKPCNRLPDQVNEPNRFTSAIALSNDGQRMLIYRDDASGNGDIYESVLKGDQWSKPELLPAPINSDYHESSASYSPDGKRIYFVSNRPGGQGGRDIWFAVNRTKDKWDKVTNLGKIVNTPGDEEGVFMHPDGKTLYFSSDGHGGVGKMDIFSTTSTKKTWTAPVSLLEPVNTSGDDLFFVMQANGKVGYYSSSVEGGLGEQDIYKVEFVSDEKESKDSGPRLLLMKGTVLDEKTRTPIEALITISDNEKNAEITALSSNTSTGKFLASLPAGMNYGISVQAEGYLFHSENFVISDTATYSEWDQEILLKKLEAGTRIVLNNVFFEYNSTTLTTGSDAELAKVVAVLKENPGMRIRIAGHTDTRGSADYNQQLSEGRAKAVVDYLVLKGVNADRLQFKGYGETSPVNADSYIEGLPTEAEREKAHQVNRRTEMEIVE